MNLTKTMIAGAAVAAVIAAPAWATVRGDHSRAVYQAYAQVPTSGPLFGAPRASALRECSKISGNYKQYTWGNMDIQQDRACMAQHGQPE